MADINLSASLPFEGLAIATMNMISKIIEYAMVERNTMDPALLARKDAVTVKALERGERFLELFDSKLPKEPPPKG